MKITQRFALLIVAIIFVLILIEEIHIGKGFIFWANQYTAVVIKPITVARSHREDIGIVIIIGSSADESQYEMALDTVRCYSKLFKYDMYIIHASENNQVSEKCSHKDFMFRRHCVLSILMRSNIVNKWIIFLDADMAIVNPNNLIEDYLPANEKIQIVFYNRIMNQEVMAGSYLVRNSEWSRDFLMFWADYEYRVPRSFHGTDNGAIHSVIVEKGLPNRQNDRLYCEKKYWKTSKNYYDLSVYEVCMQRILKNETIPEILILEKGKRSWARDGWLSGSMWSESDFVVHGWQKRRMDKRIFAMWHSPLVYEKPFNIDSCEEKGNAELNWKYKDTFIGSESKIQMKIESVILEQQKEFDKISNSL